MNPQDEESTESTPSDVEVNTETAPNRGWLLIGRYAYREFLADGCLDLAAGLSFRSLLSLFPALIAIVAILSLFGQSPDALSSALDHASGLVTETTWAAVYPTVAAILTAPAPGTGLIIGLVVAMWSSSGYVRAFGRAMNRIYDTTEGRSFIKYYAQMFLWTALLLVLGTISVSILVLSGSIAEAFGDAFGLAPLTLAIWNVAKWFILAGIVVFVVALLYYVTPNVKQPKFRWLSVGALLAIAVSVLATIGFVIYVANFANYNATYGALAGVIILLMWLYIINAILLFGAQLDSELERRRQLKAGIHAEYELQLPPRDTRASDKRAVRQAKDVEQARQIRESATGGES